LALICVPFPFLFFRYGPAIRKRCKFARETEEPMAKTSAAQEEEEGGVKNEEKRGAQPQMPGEEIAADGADMHDQGRDVEKSEAGRC